MSYSSYMSHPSHPFHSLCERHATAAAAGALAICLMAPFLPLLLHPNSRVLGDPDCDNPSFSYFTNYFAGHSWLEGEAPLWSPYIMMGFPTLAEGQASVFHPLSLLFVLFPTGPAINWLIALSVALSGLFFFGYLRVLEIGLRAGFCGALAWGFSSAFIGRTYTGHLSILLALIALPLILMLWERHGRAGGIGPLAGLSLAYAILNFAGSPHLTYIISLFVLLYVLIQSAMGCRDKASALGRLKGICLLGAFVLIGAGVSAIQLLPSMDFAADSFRGRATIRFCGASSFAPEYLLTALCPRFFGAAPTPSPDHGWGRCFLWEGCLYFGIIPLVAVAAGLVAAPARRRIALGSCAALFFIVALGEYTPLFAFLYRYVPFFDTFRAPARYMIVTQFCLLTLAAYGLEAWFNGFPIGPPEGSESSAAPRTAMTPRAFFAAGDFRAALGWALLLLSILYGLFLYFAPSYSSPGSRWGCFLEWYCRLGGRSGPPPDWRAPSVLSETGTRAVDQMWRAIILTSAALALLAVTRFGRARRALFPAIVVVLAADMASFAWPFMATFDERITRYPESFVRIFKSAPYPARILDPTTFPNKAALYGLSSVTGYAANTLPRYNAFINVTQGRPLDELQAEAVIPTAVEAYKVLAIDFLVLPEAQIPPGAETLAKAQGRGVIRYQGAYPRVFLAEAPQKVGDSRQALARVLSPGVDLLKSPAVEDLSPAPAPAPLEANESVEFAAFARNRVELKVRANRPRVMVLNEMYAKGWIAQVNGAASQVFPANYLFRAVVVPQGESRVVFHYSPLSFLVGAWVSAILLAVLLAMLALGAFVRRGRKESAMSQAGTRGI